MDEKASGKPEIKESDIIISVDLVDAARKQLDFLNTVNKHPNLYSPTFIQNAIYRYEKFWLPLAAANKGKELAAPLDIHWIWHCHMLAPYYYEKDCMRLLSGVVVDHKLMSERVRRAALERAKVLWEEKYKQEPFDVNIDAEPGVCNGFHEPYKSQCGYDLEAAVGRQKMFFYQVSLPHYRDIQFLKTSISRYKKYLILKKLNADTFLVPCYDFDLVWHSHQLHPFLYKKDTTAILGRMFNHDDSVNERSPDSKLVRSDKETRVLWFDTFGTEFALNGCMFRGEPPEGKLGTVSTEQIFSIASKMAEVVINKVSLQNLAQNEQKFSLKVALCGRELGPTILKLKGPQRSWEGNGKGVARFTFDTGQYTSLQFELVDKKGFLCFTNKQSFGGHKFPFLPVVETTPSDGKMIEQTLPLLEESVNSKNLNLAFSAFVRPPQKGPCMLSLQAGTFQTYTMPENIEQLWGPIPLPRLPDGVPNTCIVASHK